jgi:general secretion pathway protein G
MMMRLKNSKGFTVIELLTVLTIIILIASFVMGAGQAARKRAMIAKAKSGIASLEVALSMYQLDVGSYPDSGNANLVTALTSGGGSKPAGWNGPYMQFDAKDLSGGQFIDPWGKPYVYTKPGQNHGTGIDHTNYLDIYSSGPDKIDAKGAGDDIANW